MRNVLSCQSQMQTYVSILKVYIIWNHGAPSFNFVETGMVILHL